MRTIDTQRAREFANGGDRYTGAEVRLWVHDLCDEIDRLRDALTNENQRVRDALAELCRAVEPILEAGHMNTEDLARLRSAWERA